jgi:hypothetical protein
MREGLFDLPFLAPFGGVAEGRAYGKAEPEAGSQKNRVEPEVLMEGKKDKKG